VGSIVHFGFTGVSPVTDLCDSLGYKNSNDLSEATLPDGVGVHFHQGHRRLPEEQFPPRDAAPPEARRSLPSEDQ
jgi:hypothetical protein